MKALLKNETIYSIPENRQVLSSENDNFPAYVLVNSADLDFEGKEKLSQILKAINLEFDKNVRLFEISNDNSIPLNAILQHSKNPPLVMAFGLNPSTLRLQSNAPLYRILPFENLKLILSHSIQELIANKTYKAQLWNTIKHLSF